MEVELLYRTCLHDGCASSFVVCIASSVKFLLNEGHYVFCTNIVILLVNEVWLLISAAYGMFHFIYLKFSSELFCSSTAN